MGRAGAGASPRGRPTRAGTHGLSTCSRPMQARSSSSSPRQPGVPVWPSPTAPKSSTLKVLMVVKSGISWSLAVGKSVVAGTHELGRCTLCSAWRTAFTQAGHAAAHWHPYMQAPQLPVTFHPTPLHRRPTCIASIAPVRQLPSRVPALPTGAPQRVVADHSGDRRLGRRGGEGRHRGRGRRGSKRVVHSHCRAPAVGGWSGCS